MTESSSPTEPECEHFADILDAIVQGRSPVAPTSGPISTMTDFAHEIERAANSAKPLASSRKQEIWAELMADHQNHHPGTGPTGPLTPTAITIPASRPRLAPKQTWRQRLSDPRQHLVPQVVMRPITSIMLVIAILLAGIAGLAGFGQSGEPGATTPTALANEQLEIATPMPCIMTTATPVETSAALASPSPATPPAACATPDPGTPIPAD